MATAAVLLVVVDVLGCSAKGALVQLEPPSGLSIEYVSTPVVGVDPAPRPNGGWYVMIDVSHTNTTK